MTSMKYLVLTALTFFSLSSFASGGGGGVLAAMALKINLDGNSVAQPKTPEIIFNMGQKDGTVKFAYGQLVDRQWQVQKLEMAASDLVGDPSVIKALQDSKSLNSWAEIK